MRNPIELGHLVDHGRGGGDDADSLRAVDTKAELNRAVQQLVEEGIPLGRGEIAPVWPILTGDGKAMLASNFRENGSEGPKASVFELSHEWVVVARGWGRSSVGASTAPLGTAMLAM